MNGASSGDGRQKRRLTLGAVCSCAAFVMHPLPDGVYAGRVIADVLDERRDIQAIVDAADIECVGE